jgi:hypothetical protein
MSDDRGRLTSVAWEELFPWTILAQALRLAINPRALVLAAVALVATTAGWRLCGWTSSTLFLDAAEIRAESRTPDDRVTIDRLDHFLDTITTMSVWPWQQQPLPVGYRGAAPIAAAAQSWWSHNPIIVAHWYLTAPFVGLFDPRASWAEFCFLLLCALWELVVWAFFGGAITRLAAVALAREEHLSWNHLADYARRKWTAYFTAPMFPLFGVLLATIPLACFGLLLRFDIGLVIAGALWFLVLLAGLFMAILLVGLFFGFPLMWATISVEGTDSFDALSRSYAYTLQRPLHYFFYSVVAGLLGVLGWWVVFLFASAVIGLASWGVGWWSGDRIALETIAGHPWDSVLFGGGQAMSLPLDADVSGPSAELGLKLIRFWDDILVTLAMGFVFSYFWTATTAIYFLLRRQVDAMEMDEVFVPGEEEPYGLPPLKHDAAGVPGVADAPAVDPADPGPGPGGAI